MEQNLLVSSGARGARASPVCLRAAGLRLWRTAVEAKGRVLVLDDESCVRDLVSRKLTADGYACDLAGDAETALSRLTQMNYDCILSDVNLPGMNGVEFLRRVRLTDQDVAVIMITGAPDLDCALEAMRLGAYDHLSKPLNLAKLTLTVDRAVEKRRLVLQNREYQLNLESMVLERTKQLNDANEGLRRLFISSIKALAHALEAKDEYTQGHSERVAEEAVTVARFLSLTQTEIENIWIAGFLHDIGKIGIRESVLNKRGKLDAAEWETIQQHPVLAERILGPIEELRDVIQTVRHHHERFDGTGYPDGLKGAAIPLGARILAVADSYDAMTSRRPYRDALSEQETLDILEAGAGTQFDPVIVRAFSSSRVRGRAAGSNAGAGGGTLFLQDAKPSVSAPARHASPRPSD
jgi:putative two-component system response regulator